MLSFPEAAKGLRFHRPHIIASANAEDATPISGDAGIASGRQIAIEALNEIPLPVDR